MNKKTEENNTKLPGESVEKGIDKFASSIDNKIDKFSNKIDERITSFDEEQFEKRIKDFLKKIGKGIVSFFTVIVPNIFLKTKKILESDSWGIMMLPLFAIIVMLIMVIAVIYLRS